MVPYYFWGAYNIHEMNSSTNVTRHPDIDDDKKSPARVFTANNTPSIVNSFDNLPMPTEDFVRNFGRRMHHLAMAVTDGHVADEKNVDYVVRQLAEMGTPFLAHVVGECKDDPNLKQIFSKSSPYSLAHHRVHRTLPRLRGLLHARQRRRPHRRGRCRRALRARPRLRLTTGAGAPPSPASFPARRTLMIERIRTKALWAVIVLAVLVVPLALLVSPWWWLLEIVFVPLVLLGIYDYFQPRHSILRNYPLAGRMRFLLEGMGPELHQYLVENDTDGRPFDRDTRSVIYERAKNVGRQEAVRHRARRLRAPATAG